MNKDSKNYYALILIVGILMGYSIGFMVGTRRALDWTFNKAIYFLDLKGIEIDLDLDQLKYGAMQWKHRIDACYPTLGLQNKSIFTEDFDING